MNTNSKDVVKNVESNNVESTSNEQRQTNKPIVISRRRLLRAGVAGIPVVLTMAGVAPADGIQTEPSAASAMWYGGNKVYNRFAGDDTVKKDGLVWTDHNGFVLKSTGGVYTDTYQVSKNSESTGSTTLTLNNGQYVGTGTQPENIPPISLNVSVTLPTLQMNAYMHKSGEWYTDRIVRNATSTVDLLDYIKEITLTITDGTTQVGTYTSSGGSTAGSNTTNLRIIPAKPELSPSTGKWYNTGVLGYALEGNDEISYYLLPAPSEDSTINQVNYKATLEFYYTIDDIKYSCNQTVTIPLILDVTDIPQRTNDDHSI